MKFSIILPVYNVECFLTECIDSLLNQQNMTIGQDYELIFVNDGSTDHSLELLNDFATTLLGGVIIISQVNSGVSAARNVGLKHARGEYVWFVDPDDLVAPESLYWADIELKKNPHLKVIRFYNQRISENVNPRELLAQQYTPDLPQTSTAFSLIVNRQFLWDNGISFNTKMTYGEDTLWVFEVNFMAGDKAVGDGGMVNYFYRIRQGSAMTTHNDESKLKHLTSMEVMLNAYEKLLNDRADSLTPAQQKHLRKRVDWSVQNVLFDSLFLRSKEERQNVFRRIAYRQKSLNWDMLSLQYGVKNLFVGFIGLPLKYKPYHALMGWLFSKIKK